MQGGVDLAAQKLQPVIDLGRNARRLPAQLQQLIGKIQRSHYRAALGSHDFSAVLDFPHLLIQVARSGNQRSALTVGARNHQILAQNRNVDTALRGFHLTTLQSFKTADHRLNAGARDLGFLDQARVLVRKISMLVRKIPVICFQSMVFAIQASAGIDELIDSLFKLCQVFAVHVPLVGSDLTSNIGPDVALVNGFMTAADNSRL